MQAGREGEGEVQTGRGSQGQDRASSKSSAIGVRGRELGRGREKCVHMHINKILA